MNTIIKKIILLSVLFVLLGIIYSQPLIFNFNSSLPYSYTPAPVYSEEHLVPGDYLLLYYIDWLCRDYFVTPGQHFFQEPYMFSIPDWPRPYEPRGLPSSFLFFIFSIFGNISAYNCMILASFLLCGIFTFLLVHKYLNNTAGALVSALIFTLSPFRLNQLFGGHPTGFVLFWIPLIVYLYELLWEKRRWIFGWLAGISVFLMAMEEHHMGYYTALFTIVFWLYKYIFCNKNKLNLFQFISLLIPVGIGWTGALTYMMYIKTIVINTSIASGGRTFNEIGLYAPVINNIFQRINADGEKCIYVGIIAGILILIGLLRKVFTPIKAQKEDTQTSSFPFLFFFLTFLISLLLCLGPNFKYVPIYKLCYKFIPFFHFPRVPGRIFMFTLLSISLLAGYGVKHILVFIKNTKLKYYTVFAIVFLLCWDFHPFPEIGLSKFPKGNKTYDYIKEDSPNNPLLEIPLWPGDSSWTAVYLYYTTLYRIPLINGYSPFATQKYVDDVFWSLVSINMGVINKEQYDLLKKLNIKYINLHEEAYPQKVNPFPFKLALRNLKESPFIEHILTDDPIHLFKVNDKPLSTPQSTYTLPSETGIFYECEYMPHRIGEIITDPYACGEKALYADSDVEEPTHMTFGPWQLFPPGKYKILYRIKTNEEIGINRLATLEITTDNGNKQIISEDIFGSETDDYKDYILKFTLDELTPLEFRIIYYGKGGISADYIYLLCEDTNDPTWYYKAKELFHTGREKDNALYVNPKLDPLGKMVFGPYRRYMEGKYRIGFKIKAEELSKNPSAVIEVTSGHNENPLIQKTLSHIPTEYQTYNLDITLNKPAVLEFRIDYLQEVPLYVDDITVEKL